MRTVVALAALDSLVVAAALASLAFLLFVVCGTAASWAPPSSASTAWLKAWVSSSASLIISAA